MEERRSINIQGFGHGTQPIPAASRVGNIIVTGGIYGLDRDTGQIPDDVSEQTVLMFANLKQVIEAGGGTMDKVVKMTFWIKDGGAREAINDEWVALFPNPESRPARHTLVNEHLPLNILVQCDAMVVLDK